MFGSMPNLPNYLVIGAPVNNIYTILVIDKSRNVINLEIDD